MFSIEWEEIRMLKIAQPVNTIVARHALSAELLGVVSHEYCVMLVVAVNACLQVKGLQVSGMACVAGDILFGIIRLV